jgi:uncharacterized iron-regulated membrane protein
MAATSTGRSTGQGIDPRGPRFAAAITTVVLALAFVLDSAWVLGFQVLVFAVAAIAGLQWSPYAWLYRTLVRPRLAPPAELEDPAPPRFAQAVGLVVAGLGLVFAVAGVDLAVEVGAGLAFIAAALNAVFGLCLGCELYLLLARLRTPRPA